MNLDPNNLAPQPASDWRESDFVEIDSDARETIKPDGTPNSTEQIVAIFDDLALRLAVTTWADDGCTACYGEAGREILARNPDELREIARRYREFYAPAMEHVAALWEAGRDSGTIPTTEAAV
ncbi:hypothetical protein BAAM0483_02380 [Bifidobacterium animalis subsp. animalis MCC 0483]|uniref:Uncharacterized protein n=2 Tax=Bifidobacterium animalis TaxID=28025 RepID=A0AB34TAE5_9BIFI|nr:hypothetical protein BAAM0483_02380 [Bifidobacterium animalis subsp. animalis MCC 0483]